jgi:hypothetical protein
VFLTIKIFSKMFNFKSFIILSFALFAFGNILQAQNSNKRTAGQTLGTGEYEIVSANDKYYAKYENGNIEIRIKNGQSFTTFYTFHVGGASLKVQDDGNLVAYDDDGTMRTSTGTSGRGGSGTNLQIRNDGNLVLYSGTLNGLGDGDPLWATGTCGGVVNGCGATGPR